MIRALTILAAVVALAVSAQAASAGVSKKPAPRGTTSAHEYGHLNHLDLRVRKPTRVTGGSGVTKPIDRASTDLRRGSSAPPPRAVKDGSSNTVTFGE